MAQIGLCLFDEGRTITVLNDSGTTAITAGDPVYSAANDDVFETTFSRSAYAAGDVKVKSILWTAGTTAQKAPMGVALTDIAADGYGVIARAGVFMHPVSDDTEAGACVQLTEQTTTKTNNVLVTLSDPGTTAPQNALHVKVGRTLTGGSTAGEYVLWQLSL